MNQMQQQFGEDLLLMNEYRLLGGEPRNRTK
jgi:hypothetical protein